MLRLFAVLALGTILCGAPALAQTPGRFDQEIENLSAAPAQESGCPILFLGSSSVRLWQGLDLDMAPIAVANHGFGGATIAEINAAFDGLTNLPRPWAIFFYAGENDIHEGATPDMVVEQFTGFLRLKSQRLGATPVYFISLKPSPARWQERPAQRAVNAQVRRMARARRDLVFIDVTQAMIEHGRPRAIFVEDGLHLNDAGYAIWRRRLRPHVLDAIDAGGQACANTMGRS